MLAEGGLEPLCLFRVKRFSEPLHFRLGSLVLAKHTKHLSLVDILPVGADRMRRSFEPMRKQVEAWKGTRLPDESRGNHCPYQQRSALLQLLLLRFPVDAVQRCCF